MRESIAPVQLIGELPADCEALLYASGDIDKLSALLRSIEPKIAAADAIFTRVAQAAYCGGMPDEDSPMRGVILAGHFDAAELAQSMPAAAPLPDGRAVYQLERYLFVALRADRAILALPEELPRFIATAQQGASAWPTQPPWREALAAAEVGRHTASFASLGGSGPKALPFTGFLDIGDQLAVNAEVHAKGIRSAKGMAMAFRLMGHMMLGDPSAVSLQVTQVKRTVRVQARVATKTVIETFARARAQMQAAGAADPTAMIAELEAQELAELRAGALEHVKSSLAVERNKHARALLKVRLDALEGRHEKAAKAFAKWLAAARKRPRDALDLHEWATAYAELAEVHAASKAEALALLARHEAAMLAGNAGFEDVHEWYALASRLHGTEYTLAHYDRVKAAVPAGEGGKKLVFALSDLMSEALVEEERFEDLEPLANAIAGSVTPSAPLSVDELDAVLLALDVFINRERLAEAETLVVAYVRGLPETERAHALRFAIGHARSYDATELADALLKAAPLWLDAEAQLQLAQDLERDAESPF